MKNIETWNSYMTIRTKIDLADLVRIVVDESGYDGNNMKFYSLAFTDAGDGYLDIKLLSRVFGSLYPDDKLIAIAEVSEIISILSRIPYACRDTFVIDVDEYDTTPFGVSLTIEAAGYRIIEEIILS